MEDERYDEAADEFEKALEAKPDFPEARQALERCRAAR